MLCSFSKSLQLTKETKRNKEKSKFKQHEGKEDGKIDGTDKESNDNDDDDDVHGEEKPGNEINAIKNK